MLRGPNTRTPTEALHLKPGELVRIMSRDDILKTLDKDQKNRGLMITHAMARNCRDQFEFGTGSIA